MARISCWDNSFTEKLKKVGCFPVHHESQALVLFRDSPGNGGPGNNKEWANLSWRVYFSHQIISTGLCAFPIFFSCRVWWELDISNLFFPLKRLHLSTFTGLIPHGCGCSPFRYNAWESRYGHFPWRPQKLFSDPKLYQNLFIPLYLLRACLPSRQQLTFVDLSKQGVWTSTLGDIWLHQNSNKNSFLLG